MMASLGRKIALAGVAGTSAALAAYAYSNDALSARSQFATYQGQFAFPASSNFPDLSQHNNHMASVLTPQVCIFTGSL